jgi:ligand-binding sensor domain-containing protein
MKKNKLFVLTIFIIATACSKDDNKEQKVFQNLNNRSIRAIVVDKSDNVWIGTDSGLYKSVTGGFICNDLPVSNNILSVYCDKNADILWVCTMHGLAEVNIANSGFSGSAVTSSNLGNDTVRSAFVDSSSRNWFGTNSGVTLNRGNYWRKSKLLYNSDISEYMPLDLGFDTTDITCIASWNGDYFFGTNGRRLYRAYGYNSTVDAFTGATQWSPPYNGDAVSDTIFAVFVDSNGNIWIGGKDGVQEHTGSDPLLNNTVYTDGLPNLRIHAFAQAQNGNIWAGTENGIAVFNGSTWSAFSASLPNPFVTAIAFENNKAWIGTKKGLVSITY